MKKKLLYISIFNTIFLSTNIVSSQNYLQKINEKYNSKEKEIIEQHGQQKTNIDNKFINGQISASEYQEQQQKNSLFQLDQIGLLIQISTIEKDTAKKFDSIEQQYKQQTTDAKTQQEKVSVNFDALTNVVQTTVKSVFAVEAIQQEHDHKQIRKELDKLKTNKTD